MKKIKVALIHNIISPYRIPVFNELAKNKKIDLTVYFLNEGAHNRRWKVNLYKKRIEFKYEVLPVLNLRIPFTNSIEYNINPTIFKKIFKNRFDVIITSGWVDFACQILPFIKNIFKFKLILWAGSTKDEPSLQRKLTLPFVKIIIKKADAIIPYGSKSKKYLINLGAKKDLITNAYNSIDVNYFKKQLNKLNKNKIIKLKNKYKIQKNKIVLLYVGQFIKRKNASLIIRSVINMKKKVTLVFLGHGPEKAKYQILAKKHNVELIIIDHLERDKIHEIYSLADIFILPSVEEVWGLVVNEAMACSLPVICSDKVGCISDLIINDKNGYIFDNNQVNSLTNKINLIISKNHKDNIMGKESKKIISKFTPKKVSNSMMEAINKSIKT